MKLLTATLLLGLSFSWTANAQQASAEAGAALNHQGRFKVWLGVALMSAGAVVAIPRSTRNEDPSAASSAAIGLGMASGAAIYYCEASTICGRPLNRRRHLV
jgi:hypothetical protein